MSNTIIQRIGYSGTVQQLTWNKGNGVLISAYLWGAGGGAGGNDSAFGGFGSGGVFTQTNFTVNNGDVIEVAVGSGGGGGVSGRGSAAGGPPGASYVSGGFGYSGGRGGYAGGSGSSGGGGGGGGATVVFVNGTAVAVAGGGGGGGGGGHRGVATGQSAPGDRGQASVGTNAGQNGQDKSGDGGGGGGGGGGYGGGQGGTTPSGDQGGYAGSYGGSTGSIIAPNGITPGGSTNPYYVRGIGTGGTMPAESSTGSYGGNGYAVLEYPLSAASINYSGSFVDIQRTWIKNGGVWAPVKQIYVKDNDLWQLVGGNPPTFTSVTGTFGVAPRPFSY